MKKADLKKERKKRVADIRQEEICGDDYTDEEILDEDSCQYITTIPCEDPEFNDSYYDPAQLAVKCQREEGHTGHCAADIGPGRLLEWEGSHLLCWDCHADFPEEELVLAGVGYFCEPCLEIYNRLEAEAGYPTRITDSRGFELAQSDCERE